MGIYSIAMAAGSVVLFLLYGLYGTKISALRDHAGKTALLSLIFSGVFGVILARMSYALLMLELDFAYDGLEALSQLLEFSIGNTSFFGGAAGVCLGVLLANRLTNKGTVLAGMDAFAPFGALLTALFRFGEVAMGSYGCGAALPDGSPFAFFPFAIRIEVAGGYSYWGWAVCVLSGVLALAWAYIAFKRLPEGRTGLRFSMTLFFLAMPQILCESMRKRGMFWLFVHVEQVLCALVLLVVMICWIVTARGNMPGMKRWLPLIGYAVCVGLVVADEFAIDGKLFDIAPVYCYLFMVLVLIAISACGLIAMKRWNHTAD